jgi:DNA-binding XRE family transcriptional regulator
VSVSIVLTAECGEVEMKNGNNVRKIREDRLMSKMELARLAGVSSVTIDRIERGQACRMETKRRIILALGYALTEKEMVFPA